MFEWGERAFRARLKRELPAWRAEGLVDEATAEALAERYALEERDGRDLATQAVYLLGALLIGGGVISLVAWNWEALPAAVKLLLIGGLMVAVHVVGFRWWRVDGRRPSLGHALTVLGTLVFGANVGLVAQVFHISGDWYDGFLAWAAGALVAAWAYGSTPHAVVAAAVGFVGWAGLNDEVLRAGAAVAPYAFPALLLPLAWRRRSRVLFLTVTVAFAVALPMGIERAATRGDGPVYAALGATVAALAAWGFLFAPGTTGARFAGIARIVGLASFVGVTYLASFAEIADDIAYDADEAAFGTWIAALLPLGLVVPVLAGRRPRGAPGGREAPASFVAALAAPILLAVAATGGVPLAVAANAALVALAAVSIRTAVEDLERGPFWAGSVLACALIVTRFLEFETDLWLKALAFIAAGVLLIIVGTAFERRLHRSRARVA